MKRKKDGCLIVVSGPSGAGKDTICNELLKRHEEMHLSISMTTRDVRPGEKEGINYYFVTENVFKENIEKDNFLEYACVYDKYYGTPKSKIIEKLNEGIDVILVIDVQGAQIIKENVQHHAGGTAAGVFPYGSQKPVIFERRLPVFPLQK